MTSTARAGAVGLDRLSLRERENAFLAGGTQVGKSTLSDALWREFLHRYARKGARVHISDTKPRYRVRWNANGLSARRRYAKWSHGETVDGVLVETPGDMETAWRNGHRVTVCQSKRWAPAQDLCIAHFDEEASRKRPQLLVVDETKDHFYGNGAWRGTGALVDVARSGNERGEGGLYCSQRTKGIAPELLEMQRRLYAFRLDNRTDAKRFAEFGAPIGPDDLPTSEYRFLYWWKGDYGNVWGPYQLTLPRNT